MEIISYQCPSCGAPLNFSGEDNKLHCSGCENAYERENIEQFGDAEAKSKEESSFRWSACSGEETLDTVVYTCPQCGGEITGDQVTAAARCPYCDNNVVMSSQVFGVLKPDLIIPFKTTKEQAIEALKNFYKKKKLLPDAFKSENRIKEIKGIYVPFWLFDCDASASFVFDCTQVSSWRSGDYEYTKTDHYAAVRSGNADFDGIPVDASSKMADDFMDSLEPFDLKDAISFDEAVLSGFLADKFDVSSE